MFSHKNLNTDFRRKLKFCFKCKQPGHTADKCTNKAKKANKKIVHKDKLHKVPGGNTRTPGTKKKFNPKRCRNWCFTSFEKIHVKKIYEDQKDIIRYICVGDEICPKTGKKHYQGWLQLVNPKT